MLTVNASQKQSTREDRTLMLILKMTRRVGVHFPSRVLEWFLASMMLTWGLILGNVSDYGYSQPGFVGLARLASSDAWAAFAIIIGLIRLACLTINGAWQPSPLLRAFGAFLAVFMWLQITLGMFASSYLHTGFAVYPWLMLGDIYNVYRSMSDARLAVAKSSEVEGSANSAGN